MKLKGHTLIELKDVNTGEVEKIESDNFVTEFPKELFKQMGWLNPTPWANREDIPIDDLFGGIMCFDTAITDNADMTGSHPSPLFAPSSKTMTANGSVAFTSSSTSALELGAYNQTDSGYTELSRKYVYDWDTQEGNGDIGCVCLTSKLGGFKGMGNATSQGKDTSLVAVEPMQMATNAGADAALSIQGINNQRVAYLHRSRNVIALVDAFEPASGTITIKEYDIAGIYLNPFKSISDVKTRGRVVNTRTYTFTAITDDVNYWQTGSAYGYWYVVTASAPNNDNNIVNVLKFNIDNTQNQYRIPNLRLGYINGNDPQYSRLCFAFIGNHFISANQAQVQSGYNYVKDTNLNNLSITSLGTLTAAESKGCMVLEGVMYLGSYLVKIVNDEAVLLKQNTESGFIPGNSSYGGFSSGQFIDDPYTFYNAGANRLAFQGTLARPYLATINNLSQVVTKTAQKTMKITYTLTLQTS